MAGCCRLLGVTGAECYQATHRMHQLGGANLGIADGPTPNYCIEGHQCGHRYSQYLGRLFYRSVLDESTFHT